jgi:hemerythrin-like metal-binding protein
MAYFEWADDMVIDNGPIDEDHKKLVNLVNELHTATSVGRGQEVIEAIMSELITYTKDHLLREEQAMAALKFQIWSGTKRDIINLRND